MKRVFCFVFALITVLSLIAVSVFATDYTAFDIVFDEKDGAKVNETEIRIFASVGEGELTDRTGDFTMEGVEWFKYVSAPASDKNADDYDYVDEELKIYGILCTADDVFDHENYSYFLRIARLYAKEEDSFDRNVKINGVDIEEMNGLCFNTGNEFFIKTVTNGHGGSSGEGDVTDFVGGDETSGAEIEDPAKKKCKVCGICPVQPLGICLFIWIAIILIVVILAFVLLSKGKKDKKTEKDEKKSDN